MVVRWSIGGSAGQLVSLVVVTSGQVGGGHFGSGQLVVVDTSVKQVSLLGGTQEVGWSIGGSGGWVASWWFGRLGDQLVTREVG